MESAPISTCVDVPESAQVFKWRFECLIDAGWPYGEAAVIADHHEVDLHLAVELARKNCSPELALRILL